MQKLVRRKHSNSKTRSIKSRWKKREPHTKNKEVQPKQISLNEIPTSSTTKELTQVINSIEILKNKLLKLQREQEEEEPDP